VAVVDRPPASANRAQDQRIFSNGRQEELSFVGNGAPRVPNFQGKSVRDVIQESAALGIPIEFTGSGIARAQMPEAGAALPTGRPVRVEFGR
jgi:hypothetical protein